MSQPQRLYIYDSAKSKGAFIEEIKAVIRYRDLLVQLVKRDILTRYKRSFLGVFWTMLNPLGTMVILSIVFSQVFEMRGVYPAYIITNLISWNFFSQSTQFSLNSTLWGSMLYHKIYMPRTSFILATVGTNIVNFLLALVPLLLIFMITQVPIRSTILLLPFALLLLGCFALGISLLVSTLVVFFPDMAEFYPVLLTAWMYLTPIIYPEDLLTDVLNGWILKLNPLYHLIKIFRLVVFDGRLPTTAEWATASAIAAVVLLCGWFIFTRLSKKFGYYV